MVGDSVDNVKGADGIGPKMATKIIKAQMSDDHEACAAVVDGMNKRQKAGWDEFLARLPMLQEIFTLRRDLTGIIT
jgi:5'-3' exonuclease